MDERYYEVSVNGTVKQFLGILIDDALFIRVYQFKTKYVHVLDFIQMYEGSE